MNDHPRGSMMIPIFLFCFAALGFVWSVEATCKVVLRLLGL
jgi:hypothetical protein